MTKSKLLANVNAMCEAACREIDNPRNYRKRGKFTAKQLREFKCRNYLNKKGNHHGLETI